ASSRPTCSPIARATTRVRTATRRRRRRSDAGAASARADAAPVATFGALRHLLGMTEPTPARPSAPSDHWGVAVPTGGLNIRVVATGLLVVMALIFVSAKYYQDVHPAIGFVRAFAEAAMVGG